MNDWTTSFFSDGELVLETDGFIQLQEPNVIEIDGVYYDYINSVCDPKDKSVLIIIQLQED